METCVHTNSPSTSIRRDTFIVAGVPDSIPDSELRKAFANSNAKRLGHSPGALLARLRSAERLQRRLHRGPNAGRLVPSRSVRFTAEPSIVKHILATGHAVLDFQALEVRSYTMPLRHCYHCGKAGHVAKHCRSKCHRCEGRHPTEACPLGKPVSAGPARSQTIPPGFARTDVTGSRPSGRPH